MTKKETRDAAFKFLGSFDSKIRTKLNNICGKTGQYNVPGELFQKRTSRKNRVLISWKTVKNNNLSLEQLETFTGGVVVEFVNNDFFDENELKNPLFRELKKRLGGNDVVASMISIRTEDGSSSSQIPRKSFEKLKNLFPNYKDKIIRRKNESWTNSISIGNEKWEGFIYISIRGGQQDIETTHKEYTEYQLFNPACEFASEKTSLDIDLVMSYFALFSIDKTKLDSNQKTEFNNIKMGIETFLKKSEYENSDFTGNLLDYCQNQPSLKMIKNKLLDPIQVVEINIEDFAIDDKKDHRNLDFTHNEAVNKDKYYWDNKQNCLLSAARPTNIFWSKHLSNMMQQNFSLDEYFKHEESIVKRRKQLLN